MRCTMMCNTFRRRLFGRIDAWPSGRLFNNVIPLRPSAGRHLAVRLGDDALNATALSLPGEMRLFRQRSWTCGNACRPIWGNARYWRCQACAPGCCRCIWLPSPGLAGSAISVRCPVAWRLREAAHQGFCGAIVPKANAPKKSRVGKVEVIVVERWNAATDACC